VYSFLVYTKFTVESGGVVTGMGPAAAIGGAYMGQLIQVHALIVSFTSVSFFFALLAITWYGAGLICEDRRAGAHLLYFSRPLTRRDYLLAHYATACTFGLLAVLLPSLLICVVAVFSSPEYSFLTKKWDVIVGAIAYSLIFVAVTSLIVLAVSGVSARKTYALAGVFALFIGTQALGMAMWALQRDSDYLMVSIPGNFFRLSGWLLSKQDSMLEWNPWYTVAVLGGIVFVSIAVVAGRLRRMEVVA
jgi:ABC-type transport system involved in multi-copper enzyme maturation permease subunit